MDSIKEPLLFLCMVIFLGGLFTMGGTIVFLVVRGMRTLPPGTARCIRSADASGSPPTEVP